jgi:hypothetical protein
LFERRSPIRPIDIIQADDDVRRSPLAQAGQAIKHSCCQAVDATARVIKQPHQKHRVGCVLHEMAICPIFNLSWRNGHVV